MARSQRYLCRGNKMNKEICHVCKKEKKPYLVIFDDNIFSYLNHEHAREYGPICQRCDQYYAMTGEFKKATKEEFKIAKKSAWFSWMMLKWWEKDEKLGAWKDEPFEKRDLREWDGTQPIAEWCRKELSKK